MAPGLTLKELRGGRHCTRATVGDLYVLMGRELERVERAPAGCVVGIAGLDEHVLKSATLSDRPACPPFAALTRMAVPIVRVAVEAARPQDIAALVAGLRLLNQADPCVQVALSMPSIRCSLIILRFQSFLTSFTYDGSRLEHVPGCSFGSHRFVTRR